VPRDTLAFIHEGEQIIPKAYNPHANGNVGGAASGSEMTALRAETAALRQDLRAGQAQFAALMGRLVKINERWDGDGLPSTRTETA
jgi:hypothetical protein